MPEPKRTAFLFEGGGTTLEQVLFACYSECYGETLDGLIKPVLLIALKDGIKGIQRSITAGFPEKYLRLVTRQLYPTSLEFGNELLRLFAQYHVELISLNGALRKIPKIVASEYDGLIINQHNAALDPGYPGFGETHGRQSHCAVLEFARRTMLPQYQFTESTVHMVSPDDRYDAGNVIGRARIEVLKDDSPDTLAERLLPKEHKNVIDTLERIGKGTNQVIIRDERLILPEHYDILEEAKQCARRIFPQG